ncbi:MAG: DUF5615 family PIN-like protein [Pirellulales bacterium]
MKLREFSFLTDENIHGDVVGKLRGYGCDVLDVCEAGLNGSSDVALLQLAHAQNRVVVTHDSDFGKLVIARLEPMIGIVYLRPGHIDPKFTIQSLEVLFELPLELNPPFLLVAKRAGDAVTVRTRSL